MLNVPAELIEGTRPPGVRCPFGFECGPVVFDIIVERIIGLTIHPAEDRIHTVGFSLKSFCLGEHPAGPDSGAD